MIRPVPLFLLIILFSLSLIHPAFSQCANNSQLVAGDLTPSAPGVTNTQTFGAGQYMLAYVIKDASYTVSTCGTSSFDTQLTVYNDGTGEFMGYNDDYCSLQSTVNFTPSFCGYVRILLHQYSCSGSGRTHPVSLTRNTMGVTPPVVTASSSASTVCLGDPVTLSGGGAETYQWTNGVTDNVAFSPTATNTYTVTGFDGIGCKSSNTVTLTVDVNDLPTVTVTNTAPVICVGEQAKLAGAGASSYTWTGGITNNVAFNPTATNSYTVTGTDNNGCKNTATATVTVNNLPTVTVTNTAPVICVGESAKLSGAGATSYTWTGGITNNVAFNPTATNSYTVTGTDGNGCKNTATATVTVNNLPTVTVTNTAPVICVGESAKLAGVGATSYTWTGGITNNVAFNPTATNAYTVTGTDNNGCKNTATATVTVNNLPTVTVTNTAPVICVGESAKLAGAGASSYTWTGGITNNVAFNPTATNAYTVTGTDNNGCKNTASATVTVNDLPVVTANSTDAAICAGESVTLSGGGAVSYVWTGGVTDNVSFDPTATDAYTVTGTDGNGCKNTATATVTVNDLPAVTANTSDADICIGESVTLSGGGAVSYVWTGGVTDNVSFDPAATDSYTVTGTDINGCENSASTTVTVNDLPVVTANSTAAGPVCAGESVTLSGAGAESYAWTGGVTDNVSFNPTATDTYTVTGTDNNGCTNTATETVTVKDLPSAATTLTGTMITASLADASYQWLADCGGTNELIDNETGQSYTPVVAGNYSVVVTKDGCSATSSCISIVTSIHNAEYSASVNVYPNPNTGSFTIKSSVGGTYRLINDLGQTVDTFQLDGINDLDVDLVNVKNGMYMLVRVDHSDNKTISKKIVVSR